MLGELLSIKTVISIAMFNVKFRKTKETVTSIQINVFRTTVGASKFYLLNGLINFFHIVLSLPIKIFILLLIVII